MQKEQMIKTIIFVAQNWHKSRKKAEKKLSEILPFFSQCQQCKDSFIGKDIFWIVEEVKKGLLIKRYETDLFSVCCLKCFFDRGLKKKAYYSIVVKQASGRVLLTGFSGPNAVAIHQFTMELSAPEEL